MRTVIYDRIRRGSQISLSLFERGRYFSCIGIDIDHYEKNKK